MMPPAFTKFDNLNKDSRTVGLLFWFQELISLFLIYAFSRMDMQLASVLTSVLSISGAIWFGYVRSKIHFSKEDFKKTFTWKEFGNSFLVMSGLSMLGMSFILFVNALIVLITGRDLPVPEFTFDFSQFSSWLLLNDICIVGPILEELLFRGIILRTLSKYHVGFAIVSSSIIFGMYHMYLTQGFHAFLIGLVFAYVAVKSKSLLYPILLHIVHNTVTTLSSLAPSLAIVSSIFRIACLIYLFYWASKHLKELKQEKEEDPMAYPLYSQLFLRVSFILLIGFILVENIGSLFMGL